MRASKAYDDIDKLVTNDADEVKRQLEKLKKKPHPVTASNTNLVTSNSKKTVNCLTRLKKNCKDFPTATIHPIPGSDQFDHLRQKMRSSPEKSAKSSKSPTISNNYVSSAGSRNGTQCGSTKAGSIVKQRLHSENMSVDMDDTEMRSSASQCSTLSSNDSKCKLYNKTFYSEDGRLKLVIAEVGGPSKGSDSNSCKKDKQKGKCECPCKQTTSSLSNKCLSSSSSRRTDAANSKSATSTTSTKRSQGSSRKKTPTTSASKTSSSRFVRGFPIDSFPPVPDILLTPRASQTNLHVKENRVANAPRPPQLVDTIFNFSAKLSFNQHYLAISGFFKNDQLQRIFVNDDVHCNIKGLI